MAIYKMFDYIHNIEYNNFCCLAGAVLYIYMVHPILPEVCFQMFLFTNKIYINMYV